MSFTNSPLVNYVKISPNRTPNRNHKIDTITIHCVVGQCSVETLGNVFAPTSRRASSNYGVGYDGRIGMYCEEKDRSWCSSSGANDHRAITIEVASDNFYPYAVTQAALNGTIKLVADICKRNGIKKLLWKNDKSLIGKVDKQNMTLHQWFSATACPGKYLQDQMGYIADEVNKILGAVEKPSEPTTDGKINVGDIVQFLGGKHYSTASSSVAAAGNLKAGKAKVTRIVAGAKHPYHLVHIDSASNVYGWVDSSSIENSSNNSNNNSSSNTGKIGVGSVVKVKQGAKSYKGASIASFVYNGQYRVDELSGSRAVLDKTGICTAFNVSDLILVSGGTTNNTPVVTAIKKGDKVKVKNNAKDYNGNGLASFVYKTIYTVLEEPKGDRVVIGLNGVVTAAIHKNNLIKV